MDLTLDDDQRLLAESARQLFERTYPTSEARKAEERPERFSAELWTQAGELGWPGIALPEDVGGAGYGVLELAVLAEELGRAAVTLPLLTSYAAALPLLRAGRDAPARERWLGPLTTGDAVGALALLEPGGRSERAAPTLRGAATDGGWALSGTKLAVRFGARADVLVASVDLGHGRPSLLAVPTDAPGIDRRAHDTFSPEPLAAVTFTDVVVGPDDVVGEPGRAAAAIERALDHLGVRRHRVRRRTGRRRARARGRPRVEPRAVRAPDRRQPGGVPPVRRHARRHRRHAGPRAPGRVATRPGRRW